MIANDSSVFGKTDFFKCFYNSFTENSTIWFAYHDDNKEYENPFKLVLTLGEMTMEPQTS